MDRCSTEERVAGTREAHRRFDQAASPRFSQMPIAREGSIFMNRAQSRRDAGRHEFGSGTLRLSSRSIHFQTALYSQ